MTLWQNRPYNPETVERIAATLAAWIHTLARIIEYIHYFR